MESIEILFRGKDKDNGQWYTGYYWKTCDTSYCFKEDYERHPENTHHYLLFDSMTDWGLPNRKMKAEILPETLGVYIGLNDDKGKRLFTGDIVELTVFDYNGSDTQRKCKIEIDESGGVWFNNIENDNECFLLPGCNIVSDDITWLGTVYDNPELIKNDYQEE